jgi:hypothetical protein
MIDVHRLPAMFCHRSLGFAGLIVDAKPHHYSSTRRDRQVFGGGRRIAWFEMIFFRAHLFVKVTSWPHPTRHVNISNYENNCALQYHGSTGDGEKSLTIDISLFRHIAYLISIPRYIDLYNIDIPIYLYRKMFPILKMFIDVHVGHR